MEYEGYGGAIMLPPSGGRDMYTVKTNFSTSFVVVSTGTAKLTGYVTTDSVSTLGEWSDVSNLYQEARVLGLCVAYEPFYNVSSSAAVGCGAICSSHEVTLSNPSTVNQVLEFTDHRLVRTTHPFKMEWRARGVEEMVFQDITNWSTAGPGIKWCIEDTGVSQAYGRVYVTYLVEFRGRK